MQSLAVLALVLMLASPAVQADDLMDWLHEAAGNALHSAEADGDHASLLTLEPGENEMYPKVSPDGRHLLTVSGKHAKPVISLRMVENGDPVNVVSDFDQQVMDSIAWHGTDQVTFLSYRADSLGLWQKPVIGGMIRRLYRRLDGELMTPLVLDDGSMIVVRLNKVQDHPLMQSDKKQLQATFVNWQLRGYQSNIARISEQGAETELTPGANPSLSPDGSRLVFSIQNGHHWHLFMMNTDGSDLVQLTEGDSIDVQPTWSPDGKWIAFTSNRGSMVDGHAAKENWDIWMIGRNGRNLMRLTVDPASDGAPSIANNGRVYFHSDRKVSREESKTRRINGGTAGFHIWGVPLPAKVS